MKTIKERSAEPNNRGVNSIENVFLNVKQTVWTKIDGKLCEYRPMDQFWVYIIPKVGQVVFISNRSFQLNLFKHAKS